MRPKDAEGIANSVDPDQTAPDLGLHCLPRPLSKTLGMCHSMLNSLCVSYAFVVAFVKEVVIEVICCELDIIQVNCSKIGLLKQF